MGLSHTIDGYCRPPQGRSPRGRVLRYFPAGNLLEVVPIPGKPRDQAAIVRF